MEQNEDYATQHSIILEQIKIIQLIHLTLLKVANH